MKWLKRIRGAIGVGLTWAVGWAVAGVSIGVASILLPWLPWDAFFKVFDAPLPAFAVPGFFAGVFFSIVLGIAGRRRTLRELSVGTFATWGAIGGLLLTAFPFALVTVGLADRSGSNVSDWQILAVITLPFVALSAVSATASLLLARRAARLDLPDGATQTEIAANASAARLGEGSASIQMQDRAQPKHVKR